jgi:hypothetical protein
MAEIGWVLNYLDDLASDFSAVHRVPDMTVLDGPAFFKLAYRMTAYRGVMRERAVAEQEDGVSAPQVAQPAVAAPAVPVAAAADVPVTRGATMVPATKVALQNEPGFPGVFSFGEMSAQ